MFALVYKNTLFLDTTLRTKITGNPNLVITKDAPTPYHWSKDRDTLIIPISVSHGLLDVGRGHFPKIEIRKSHYDSIYINDCGVAIAKLCNTDSECKTDPRISLSDVYRLPTPEHSCYYMLASNNASDIEPIVNAMAYKQADPLSMYLTLIQFNTISVDNLRVYPLDTLEREDLKYYKVVSNLLFLDTDTKASGETVSPMELMFTPPHMLSEEQRKEFYTIRDLELTKFPAGAIFDHDHPSFEIAKANIESLNKKEKSKSEKEKKKVKPKKTKK